MCFRALKRITRLFSIHFYLGLVVGYIVYYWILINTNGEDMTEIDETLSVYSSVDFTKLLNSDKKLILPQKKIFYKENMGNIDPLKNKVRIVCWVMTYPEQHVRKAKHIKNTWGKRCNKLLFMSTKRDKKLGVIDLNITESSWNLRRKTQDAWRYIYKNHLQDGEWFLAVEDDTYVIMDNMRQFLFNFIHTNPLSFGHLMKNERVPFLSRRPGYVLSKESVVRFIQRGLENKSSSSDCGSISWSYDDVAIGNCLDSVGVQQLDTRDSLGRLRFLPLPLETLLSVASPLRIKMFKYWSTNSHIPFIEGRNCCSDIAICFHEMSARKMYTMEYFVYHLQAYGIRTRAHHHR